MSYAEAPEAGQIVRVRARQYLVEEVTPARQAGGQTLVRLSCLDDDAQGTPLEVLWESEIDAVPVGRPTWQHAAERGFDKPQMFASYLHALRWNTVTSTNPRLFQSPYRAGIEVMAYQLEPLRKALLLPRVNLFIADDVGLGKTIEAGLILRELMMRQKVRRVVVACPPSVVAQWRDELETRFGLGFVVLDRDDCSDLPNRFYADLCNGRIFLISAACGEFIACQRSQANCPFNQKSGVVPNRRDRRSAVSGVTPRRPFTISFRRTKEIPSRLAASV